jgi:hypothetical protein
VSNIHRLKTTDKIFLITTDLKISDRPFNDPEYQIIAKTIVSELRRLGYLLFGYALMPDHWHAHIWPQLPITNIG